MDYPPARLERKAVRARTADIYRQAAAHPNRHSVTFNHRWSKTDPVVPTVAVMANTWFEAVDESYPPIEGRRNVIVQDTNDGTVYLQLMLPTSHEAAIAQYKDQLVGRALFDKVEENAFCTVYSDTRTDGDGITSDNPHYRLVVWYDSHDQGLSSTADTRQAGNFAARRQVFLFMSWMRQYHDDWLLPLLQGDTIVESFREHLRERAAIHWPWLQEHCAEAEMGAPLYSTM